MASCSSPRTTALYLVISLDEENWLVRSEGGAACTPLLDVFEDTVIFHMRSVGEKLCFLVVWDEEEPSLLLYQPLLVSPDLLPPRPVPTDDGRVVFYAYDESHGHELWVTNGQPSGTRLLQDINPGPASSYPQDLLRAGGFIYFTALDGVHGREIWTLPVPHPEEAVQPKSSRE